MVRREDGEKFLGMDTICKAVAVLLYESQVNFEFHLFLYISLFWDTIPLINTMYYIVKNAFMGLRRYYLLVCKSYEKSAFLVYLEYSA